MKDLLHYHYPHTTQSNEFLLICIHKDLLLINPPFCHFASFSIVSLTPYINKTDSSSDLTIFMISSNFLFQIISVSLIH